MNKIGEILLKLRVPIHLNGMTCQEAETAIIALFKEVVPEEKYDEQFQSWSHGWNHCRIKILDNIKGLEGKECCDSPHGDGEDGHN